MLKRVVIALPSLLILIAMLYFILPITINFTAPIPETLPFEYKAIQGTVKMRSSYDGMINFEFVRLSQISTWCISLMLTIALFITTLFQKDKRPTHSIAKLSSADSIKNHSLYQAFLDGDPQRLHIYKEDLPEEFAVWLIKHTA